MDEDKNKVGVIWYSSSKLQPCPRLADKAVSSVLCCHITVRRCFNITTFYALVVGLDIDYKTNKGTISIWRPGYVKNLQGQLELEATQTLYNQVRTIRHRIVTDTDKVFRDESGGPNRSPDAGLRLDLKDFAPEELARGISDSFFIDSAILCQFLNEAEHKEQETKQEQGVVQ